MYRYWCLPYPLLYCLCSQAIRQSITLLLEQSCTLVEVKCIQFDYQNS